MSVKQSVIDAYLCVHIFKHKALALAIVLLQRTEATNAEVKDISNKVEQFLHRMFTTTVSPFQFALDYRPQLSPDFHALDLMILLLLIAIWSYYLFRAFKRYHNKDKFELALELVTKYERIKLPLLHLFHTADMWQFTATDYVQHISMTIATQPLLNFEWPALKMSHKLLNLQQSLPTTYRLSYFQAFQLRRILAQNSEILLVSRQLTSHFYRIITLTGTSWHQMRHTPINNQSTVIALQPADQGRLPQYV